MINVIETLLAGFGDILIVEETKLKRILLKIIVEAATSGMIVCRPRKNGLFRTSCESTGKNCQNKMFQNSGN